MTIWLVLSSRDFKKIFCMDRKYGYEISGQFSPFSRLRGKETITTVVASAEITGDELIIVLVDLVSRP